VVALIGAIFVGQGLGIIRNASAMVDDIRWAIVGAVLVVIGALVGWSALRNRPRT
jgi:hypothetical protein